MPASASSSRRTPAAPHRTPAHPKPRLASAGETVEDPSAQTDPQPPRADTTHPISSAPAEPTESDLLTSLFSECDGLEDLARAHGLSLRALIEWAERHDVLALRRSMRELADDRADLIVSRARTLAAHRLRALASTSESEETSRKACVDLLRIRRGPASADTPPHTAPPSDAPTDDDDLLADLDALAKATNAPRAAHVSPDTGPSGAD